MLVPTAAWMVDLGSHTAGAESCMSITGLTYCRCQLLHISSIAGNHYQ